jgi:hypothetical protein
MSPRTLADATQHLLEQLREARAELLEVDATLAEDGCTVLVLAETTGGDTLVSGFDLASGAQFRPQEVAETVEFALRLRRALA